MKTQKALRLLKEAAVGGAFLFEPGSKHDSSVLKEAGDEK